MLSAPIRHSTPSEVCSDDVFCFYPLVTKQGSVFQVQFEDNDDDATVQLMRDFMNYRGSNDFTFYEMDRLPHELLMFTINREKPVPVAMCPGGKQNDDDDQLTPDAIVGTNCFELGTSRAGASTAYANKRNKYTRLCLKRKWNNLVLGVGPFSVKANFEFSDEDANLWIKLYSLSTKTQDCAKTHGYNPHREASDMKNIFKNSLNGINHNLIPKSLLHISANRWNDWADRSQYHLDEEMILRCSVYEDLLNKATMNVSYRVRHGEILGPHGDKQLLDKYTLSINSLPLKSVADLKKLHIPIAIIRPGIFTPGGFVSLMTPIGELWNELLSQADFHEEVSDYQNMQNLSMSIGEEAAYRKSKAHKREMLEKGRVAIKLTKTTKVSLSSTGLCAKSLRVNGKPKANTQKSLGYSLNCDCSDIESFINSNYLFDENIGFETPTYSRLRPLLKAGGFEDERSVTKFVTTYNSSNLGHAMCFLECVFSEINLNMRKPTKSNQWRLTTVKGYPCALAMHNTGTGKHVFYTLLVPKDSFETHTDLSFFRSWTDCGEYMATDVCSTRKDDVSNMLFCSQKCLTMLSTHLEVFSENMTFDKNVRCRVDFLFHLLVYLENKNQTSEVLQQVRFFYMKTNCSRAVGENFLSAIERLPNIIRSRLCAFAIKSLLHSFLDMSHSREKIKNRSDDDNEMHDLEEDEEESRSDDRIYGVVSYISGNELRNYEEALLLSYGGIYHNKEKSDELTSNLQIYRKLATEELKLDSARVEEYLEGFTCKADEMPSHGFNGPHLRSCGIAILTEIKSRGVSEDDLIHRIYMSLDSITFEEMATFKASLDSRHLNLSSSDKLFHDAYPELHFNVSSDDNKYEYGHTCKALIGVLRVMEEVHLDENTKPFHIFSSIVNSCNKHGGIVAILFKKAQFGSVREIFILTMFARIVVRFVESVSRTIAECCPNEYLTKGRIKINSTPVHYNKIRESKRLGDVVLNLYDSLDCKTWCQNFTFPAFGQVFSVLLRSDDALSSAVKDVFNMASSKRHEMTEMLMKTFANKPEIVSMSESLNVLKAGFLGEAPNELSSGNQSIFVKNVSNFMQGIFHYTSTVVHSGHLLMMGKVMKVYISESMGESVRDVIHTTKASSDDASSLLTVVLRKHDDEILAKCRACLLVCSELLSMSYPLMCAKINEAKSTRFVENSVEEFNSYWSFRNTVLSVPSKFTTAAVIPKADRSCIERMRSDHNSINSCLENGCSMQLCKIVEYCCAVNHYIIMGVENVDGFLWRHLSEDLMNMPHPGTWFYVSSPKYIGCSLGFDATLHNFLQSSIDGRRTDFVLNNLLSGSYDVKTGLLVQSSIVIGNTRKYHKFLSEVLSLSHESKCKSLTDVDPSVLYRDSTSADEVRLKILNKAESTGAERSFIRNDESTIHHSAAYLISRPSLTVSIRNSDGQSWSRKKMSLPCFLRVVKEMKSEEESINTVEVHVATALQMSKKYIDHHIRIGRRRKIPVRIRFPKTRGDQDISLYSAAKYVWFAHRNGRLMQENEDCFSEYMNKYHWLKATHHETLECLKSLGIEGNLHSVLHGLLMHEEDTDRTVVFLHTGRRDATMISSYMRCIEYCQRKNMKLYRPIALTSTNELGEFLDLERKLFPLVCIHPEVRDILNENSEEPEDSVREVLMQHRELFLRKRSEREVRFLPKRFRNLLTIGVCLMTKDQSEMLSAFVKYGMGYAIRYIKPQERIVTGGVKRWGGYGEFLVNATGVNILMKVDDDRLLEVRTSKPDSITQTLSILTKICKDLKIRKDLDQPVQSGVRISNNMVRYTSTRGTPVYSLPPMSFRSGCSMTTSFEVENLRSMSIRARFKSDNKVMTSDPIRYTPAAPGINDDNLALHVDDAVGLLVSVAPIDDTMTVKGFVVDSLKDRMRRMKLISKKRISDAQNLRDEEDELRAAELEFQKQFFSDATEMKGVSRDEMLKAMSKFPDSKNAAEVVVFDSASIMDFCQNMPSLEQIIDETNLFAEVKTTDSSGWDYEEFNLWDNFIHNFKSMTTIHLHSAVTGDYLMPREESVEELLRALIDLRIILPPRKIQVVQRSKKKFKFTRRTAERDQHTNVPETD